MKLIYSNDILTEHITQQYIFVYIPTFNIIIDDLILESINLCIEIITFSDTLKKKINEYLTNKYNLNLRKRYRQRIYNYNHGNLNIKIFNYLLCITKPISETINIHNTNINQIHQINIINKDNISISFNKLYISNPLKCNKNCNYYCCYKEIIDINSNNTNNTSNIIDLYILDINNINIYNIMINHIINNQIFIIYPSNFIIDIIGKDYPLFLKNIYTLEDYKIYTNLLDKDIINSIQYINNLKNKIIYKEDFFQKLISSSS